MTNLEEWGIITRQEFLKGKPLKKRKLANEIREQMMRMWLLPIPSSQQTLKPVPTTVEWTVPKAIEVLNALPDGHPGIPGPQIFHRGYVFGLVLGVLASTKTVHLSCNMDMKATGCRETEYSMTVAMGIGYMHPTTKRQTPWKVDEILTVNQDSNSLQAVFKGGPSSCSDLLDREGSLSLYVTLSEM